MIDSKLKDYIKQARAGGVSDDDIKKELIKISWPGDSIDEAFGGASNPTNATISSKRWGIIALAAVSVIVVGIVGYYFINKYSQPDCGAKLAKAELPDLRFFSAICSDKLAKIKSNDAGRVNNIKLIQTALEYFAGNNGNYPPDLTEVGWKADDNEFGFDISAISAVGGFGQIEGSIIMSPVPQDPDDTNNNDNCVDTTKTPCNPVYMDNSNDLTQYAITFYLEGTYGNLGPGEVCATEEGIENGTCADILWVTLPLSKAPQSAGRRRGCFYIDEHGERIGFRSRSHMELADVKASIFS